MADGLDSITRGDSAPTMVTCTEIRAIAGDGTTGVNTARKAASTITAHPATIEPTISSSNRNDGKREQPHLSLKKRRSTHRQMALTGMRTMASRFSLALTLERSGTDAESSQKRAKESINLYAVLRKEPNWSGSNRAHWLKRIVGYSLPREAEGTLGIDALMVKSTRASFFEWPNFP